MKYLSYLFILTAFACSSFENKEQIIEEISETVDHPSTENSFDSVLAKQYGADDYGMKPYVMAFLKTGANSPKDSLHAIELQTAHMANINRLAEEGKLVLAGPFYGNDKGNFRGIYIFNTSSIDSARAYTESDPAIKYGSLKMELINWYGSAALMGVNQVHTKIAKVEI